MHSETLCMCFSGLPHDVYWLISAVRHPLLQHPYTVSMVMSNYVRHMEDLPNFALPERDMLAWEWG